MYVYSIIKFNNRHSSKCLKVQYICVFLVEKSAKTILLWRGQVAGCRV